MNPAVVRCISECFVKPQHVPEKSKDPFYLTPWDLAMLSGNYIQQGLLFPKPQSEDCDEQDHLINNILKRLKKSLSLTLVHFYPLAGRLETRKEENPPSYFVFVDCNKGPGAKFIHAAVDITVSDILSPTYVPLVVESFFDHHEVANHDGHTRPLLSIQVTELMDGVFIGCSMNHAVADGTTFWHFFNTLSEIFQGGDHVRISRPPLLERWFPEGHGPLISLPFTDRFEAPQLSEKSSDDKSEPKLFSTLSHKLTKRSESPELLARIFHFSAESVAKLKARANLEYNTNKISSLQSLSAFMWRSITKARRFPKDTLTNCKLAIDDRPRLEPALSPNYFGNTLEAAIVVATAGELLEQSLGWAAWKLHQAVAKHTNELIRRNVNYWIQSPIFFSYNTLYDPKGLLVGNSPRFNMYGNEFGFGKALAVLGGNYQNIDGEIITHPGREGGGSIDLKVCIPVDSMHALESDDEFMAAVSFPSTN